MLTVSHSSEALPASPAYNQRQQRDKIHNEQKTEVEKDAFPRMGVEVKCLIRSQREEYP